MCLCSKLNEKPEIEVAIAIDGKTNVMNAERRKRRHGTEMCIQKQRKNRMNKYRKKLQSYEKRVVKKQ